MADIRINQLPLATGPTAPMQSDFVPIDGTTTRKATLLSLADVINPPASQAEAEAGTDAVKRMTPLTTKQSIASQIGTVAGKIAAGDDPRIVNSVQSTRNLIAGSGIAAIGDLSADRTISLNTASQSSLALANTSVQPNTSPSLSGATLTTTGAAQTLLSINGDAGSARRIQLSTAGIGRWFVQANASSESGSNSGSDFEIVRRSDTAASLGAALTIFRSSGFVSLSTGLSFESFGGFPTIQSNSRVVLRKANTTNTDVYNVGVLRDAVAGGTAGFVNSALRVETTVNTVTSSFEWAGLFKLNVNAAGGGEHCALYAQAVKSANGTAWSLCTELRETVSNPTTGSLGIELGMFVTGGDNNGMRHGLDISVGSADNGTGTNIITSAIRIGASTGNPARAQMVNGILLKNRITSALNMQDVDVSYSDVTVKMPTNGKLQWQDTTTSGGAIRGALAWNATVSSWQISGVLNATSATAGAATALPATPAGYMNIQLNGTMRKIPYYA